MPLADRAQHDAISMRKGGLWLTERRGGGVGGVLEGARGGGCCSGPCSQAGPLAEPPAQHRGAGCGQHKGWQGAAAGADEMGLRTHKLCAICKAWLLVQILI